MQKIEMIDQILKKWLSEIDTLDRDIFHKLKNKIYKNYKLEKPIANIEFIKRYEEIILEWKLKDNNKFKKILRKRWIRSLSWVTVISLLTKTYPCPWKCIYCPNFKWLPKSYISNEPAVMRAELNDFDPVKQIHNRLRALEITWHKIEKNDVRIIWWTWSFYPEDYREKFVKWIYDAFNTYDEVKKYIKQTSLSTKRFASFKIKSSYKAKLSKNLEEAKKINKTAKYRVIWIAIETRPDHITAKEILKLRWYWITRVEIWYQTTFDKINLLNKRWHWNKESIYATKMLKNAWFKVVAHMMPNLLWSTTDIDKKSLKKVFDDEWFRPDELKIYPMVVTNNSPLTEIWKKWWFKAYDDETLIKLIADLEKMIPEYVRLNRTYRDIPSNEILEWSHLSNIRQIVEQKLFDSWVKLLDIRHREIKNKKNDSKKALLNIFEYNASNWKEYFLTFEDKKDRTIFSLLRLRLPWKNKEITEVFPELDGCALIREVHTFWDQLGIWEKWQDFWQHMWFWKKLIKKAEKIAKKNNYKKMAVIAWMWVMQYYEKRWYSENWEYMVKVL